MSTEEKGKDSSKVGGGAGETGAPLQQDTGAKHELKLEAGPKTELKYEAGPKTELKHEVGPKTELKHEAGPKTELKHEAGPKTELKHEAGPKSELKHEAGPKTELKHEAGPKTELKHEGAPKTDLKHKSGLKTELRQEAGVKTELKLESGPKPELKHEAGPKTQLKSEMDPRSALKHGKGATPALKNEAGPKTELKTETSGGQTKLEQGSEAKVEEGATRALPSGDPGSEEAKPAVLLLLAKTMKEAYAAETAVRETAPNLPAGVRLFFGGEVGKEDKGVSEATFDGTKYLDAIESETLGRTLLLAPRLPSTHNLLSQNFHSFPVGTICVADVQYQGRGRGGNKWESPQGCLMFSFTLREKNGRTLPFLQYVVSLAVVQAIEVVSFGKGLSHPLDVRIKWPNDLYATGLKLGGVLCTSTYSGGNFNVVIGCGLNVANREPTTCLNALLEEQSPEAEPITREELLAAIITRFEELHKSFAEKGFEELHEPYIKRWLHSDQRVVLEEDASEGEAAKKVPLTIKGLTASGYLLAVDDGGESFELHPDGNSLDFFKGLMRRKLVAPSS